ncbi:MAG TPA: endolytic transglycosylase MltG [Syntrophales bacterium]|nr:endolytic transglycosylase MltG [Syntrophales bacterium]HOM06091.1 endolytic transglycosylase MltG [Syntrophales bacterium]HON99045.1 endolytic transglycosylase MltG [Syntrophales bacterium]HPC00491.1 endolytic transglycosylase MltG [Syntrophales bacterium]HPQ05574.1 endolytic transglycosylase MltG [Syntrophales bacterium]
MRRRFFFKATALAGVFFLATFILYAFSPVGGEEKGVIVEIPRGTGFRGIVEILDGAGLVANRPYFTLLALVKGAARQIRAGEYEFSASMSPTEIIDRLVQGQIKVHIVTIPEDLTVREIAARLAAEGLVDEKAFLALASDRAFLSSLGIEADSVEGYLFPETYHLDRSMTPREIMGIMVRQFWKAATPQMRKRAEEMGLSVHEWVVMASLIGKETGYRAEKPLIAAVFYNRLKKGMKLQCDPTAVYDLENFNGVIRRVHLRRDHPYNTYVIYGLPPGPIGNPGLDSLKAALYPAKVPYLYFVSTGNGSHQFSASLEEHNLAVSRYQIQMKKR